MDWVAKLIGLSDAFLNTGKGGGVIQNSASDATLLVMAAARTRILDHLSTQETIDPHVAATKLVAYSSDQTHSSCQKAAKILGLRFRALPTRDDCILRGDVVRQAMREDIAQGKDTQVWVHVDAAYAGSAMVCPEFRHFMKGVDQVDSFDFNMHKWLLIHFDCSCLFVKDRGLLVRISTGAPDARATTNPTPSTTLSDTPDLRPQSLEVGGTESGESTTTTTRVESLTDFGPSTNRRFRALRLWFTIRSYGQSGLQNFIRNHINLMRYFQTFLAADGRFEVLTPVHFSLIGLRLNPELCQRVDLGMGGVPDKSNPELRNNAANARLHGMINEAGVFLTKSDLHGKTFIRVSIGAFKSNRESVEHIWSVIQQSTDQMLLTPPQ
ncbi:hypothetical protein H4R33_006707 [Dimargaris cristalligena]|nr:hypothetical protein H4R33_006707 [Dimargaris cristalligena]